MSMFHCSIKIIGRSSGRTAVASAAYRSGEELYNEETGLIHDFTKKGGVIMSEIMLPGNAPPEYQDRQILWNEVQKIEKRSDAQLAREVEVAFPVEMGRAEQIECIRNYITENFVSKGMCADWALHDKGDGNPHAHIMLTVRGFNEHGKWNKKQKSVFALDENGNKIPQIDPITGKQKVRVREGKGEEKLWIRVSVPTNDWNDHAKAEEWRASWAEHCNKYLAEKNKIDHRSYVRQGIDREPTIHEGYIARQIEWRGEISDKCEADRQIRKRNQLREELRRKAVQITQTIIRKARELIDRFNEFARGKGYFRDSGRNDFNNGGAVWGTGTTGLAYSPKAGGDRRTAELAFAVNETESDIKETDRAIEEIKRIIEKGREEQDARLSEIRRQHDARIARRAQSGKSGVVTGERKITRRDTEILIREIKTAINAAGIIEQGAGAERQNRESLRERLAIKKSEVDDRERNRNKEREREQNKSSERGGRSR